MIVRLFTGGTETQRFEENGINALDVSVHPSLCVSVPPVEESDQTGNIA
jgi:hypothetical protein